MADRLGTIELARLAKRRVGEHAFDLPGADEVVRVERSRIVPVPFHPDRGATQRVQAGKEIELFARETLSRDEGLSGAQLQNRLRLDLGPRLSRDRRRQPGYRHHHEDFGKTSRSPRHGHDKEPALLATVGEPDHGGEIDAGHVIALNQKSFHEDRAPRAQLAGGIHLIG